MSKALTIYLLVTLVLVAPAYLSARQVVNGEMSRAMQMLVGFFVALGWPVTIPLIAASLKPRRSGKVAASRLSAPARRVAV